MSKYKKFFIVFVMVNMAISILSWNYFQAEASSFIGNIENSADNFIQAGGNAANNQVNLSGVTDSIAENFMGLGQLLTMVGAGVMVAVVSYMGINYIMSPPDKQAALKQQLIGVVVAGIVIFGAYGIWKAVVGIVSNF